MALPFFYSAAIKVTDKEFVLNEETSKHVVQVLRMQTGEQLLLTDGKGNLFTAEIMEDNRKKCVVKIISIEEKPLAEIRNTIAISLVKNSNRFEWFLEKATELGINTIIPLLCSRTEKQHFKSERMKSILISAMLQSQQTWLPDLWEPTKIGEIIQRTNAEQKFIAHCEEGELKESLTHHLLSNPTERIILIGPEGDFTKEEIAEALRQNFRAVALGNTRLRTETAGVVAATLLCIHQ